MSTIQHYKLPFEPAFHAERPIIVDESADSPETVTLRYEEAAARASNGGDLRRESLPGLLSMSAYKPQPPQMHGFDSTRQFPEYSQYSPQSFSSQQAEQNAASQMNQMAFAANNAAASQYMSPVAQVPQSVSVLSCQPSAGAAGTKVLFKISSQFDLLASPVPFVSVLFGQQKSVGQVYKVPQQDSNGWTYTVSVDAPQFMVTAWQSPSVPLSLVIEGEDISQRVDSAGVFTYHDAHHPQQQVSSGESGAASPHQKQESPDHRDSPPAHQDMRHHEEHQEQQQQLHQDVNTYTHAYPPAGTGQPSLNVNTNVGQANFNTASGYSNGSENGNMIGTYRPSYTDPYTHASSALRSPAGTGWSYATHRHMNARHSPAMTHSSLSRPSPLTPLPQPSPSAPQLIRTSTIQSPGMGNGMYNPYPSYLSKAQLKINGELETMAANWTREEWENRRRLVLFKKTQQGPTLHASFRPVTANDRPPNSICVSCIYWAERNDFFVTSVDTIHLLEQLVQAPSRFSVEEKNRIRRNLEGFRPLTVSKAKADSEEFFKVIMGFGNPKPRNIEKDVKVFPWKILGQALKKIISKYSASPSSVGTPMPPSATPTHLLTPVSVSGQYPLPAPPTTATDPGAGGGYLTHAPPPHDALASPRSLAGSSWVPPPSTYANPPSTVTRAMSPGGIKPPSPSPSGIRITHLPYDTRPPSGHYSLPPHMPPVSRWDATPNYAPAPPPDPYSHHGYSGPYGDSSQRA